MKKYILLIIAALISTVAFSQAGYKDVVYLKNGSIIHGIIVEQIPNKSVKIQTADNNVFVFQMDEIEKLTKEEIKSKANNYSYSKKRSGYCGIIETGYAFGLDGNGGNSLVLDIINGYRFNPYFSLGVGTGVHYYTGESTALIPIFADFRVNFINKKISPYFSLELGYSFNGSSSFDAAGIFFSPVAGVRLRIHGVALLFGIGYEVQGVEFRDPINNMNFVSTNVDAIKIKMGFSF
ncbi:MAG: hypothetical protein LBK94_01280 [Prevotellaceae bacterium]|jgi:hypothetical protein|nr:hypothetical protein [Prevotellaceae bacterium]